MKIVDKGTTKNGIEIKLEYSGLQIGAYPIAKNTSEFGWIKSGEPFRLTIASNEYMYYTDENVKSDYQALKDGEKTLEDLSKHFWNGKKDMFILGMIEKHEIN